MFETSEGSPAEETPVRSVVQLGPPIAESPWSPDFVMQSIEILPVFLAGDVPYRIKPIHAEKLHLILAYRGRSPPHHADYAAFLMGGVEERFDEALRGRDINADD